MGEQDPRMTHGSCRGQGLDWKTDGTGREKERVKTRSPDPTSPLQKDGGTGTSGLGRSSNYFGCHLSLTLVPDPSPPSGSPEPEIS